MHEDLRNYSALTNNEKPLIVSGILLALRERDHKNFAIDSLSGDTTKTDGQKIYDAISDNLQRSNVAPAVKKDKLLTQFAFIRDKTALNEIDEFLGKTPLRYYTEFLDQKIYKSIRYNNSAEDYLGRFYGEFMSYAGGDGQELGIILTPKHITELFCDLAQLKVDDIVLDPCCGTAGFLIAAMHRMLGLTDDESIRERIKRTQLHGFELQPHMFTIATTNMILRGDGKSNLIDCNFLKQEADKIQLKGATVGMMNPPYSQGSSKNPNMYEMCFTEHLLDSLAEGARCIVIAPQSSMAGAKTKEEASVKANILKHHTLEGVITLNRETFYGVGVNPCIAVFTAGIPHPKKKVCKFINFEDDGYKVTPHVGLVGTESAKDKKQHLLDVWFDRIDSATHFCVKTTIDASDEWLHSFYYFNDEIPVYEDFEKTVGDYLTFEFSMMMQNRGYLFEEEKVKDVIRPIEPLAAKAWKEFFLVDLFPEIQRGKRLKKEDHIRGTVPYVSSSAMNNGVDDYVGNEKRVRKFKNCLSLANSGSVGACFYEPFEFVASDHITHLQNDEFSMYTYLFIATMAKRLSEKYNFNREISDARISREKVLLPVRQDKAPDYKYMEQFIKNIILGKYNQYMKYCKNNIESEN